MNKPNKLAIATATAAALGSAGALKALTVAEPGGALLVPYAIYSSTDSLNTLVGITVASQVGHKGPDWSFDAVTNYSNGETAITSCDSKHNTAGIHWFFYNEDSKHQLSGQLPATCEDFVPFDWGKQVKASKLTALDGANGYLVFTDHALVGLNGQGSSGLQLFGDAAVIQGNWSAAAFIPVIPLRDDYDDQVDGIWTPDARDEVVWAGNPVPQWVGAINNGMALGDGTGIPGSVRWDMRYFLSDLGLGPTSTQLIVWLDNDYDGVPSGEVSYKNLHIDVYDDNEVPNDATISLPKEVNVIDASTLAWTKTKQSGFILVTAPEVQYVFDGCAAPVTTEQMVFERCGTSAVGSAVTFSLLFFGPGATHDGVQTILGHQRGIFPQLSMVSG